MTHTKTVPVPLQRFGTIIVTGPDARSFLQGQLSADMNGLTREQALLACCNSSQGRVQAVLWLVQRTDGLVLIVPASMIATTLERLRKYILRAKVQLHSGTDRLVCHASEIGPPPAATPPASSLVGPRAHSEVEGVSYVNWPGTRTRFLVLSKPSSSTYDAAVETAWHLEDLRAGLPQVYPQTHESFVAQMLNLDLLDGISFEKGCYTGQEIIARTHFRGAIKRRMFRFSASCEPPAPGSRLLHEGQHAGEIVDAAPTQSGCEMLAVVNLTLKDAALQIDGDEREETLRRLEMAYEVM